MKPGPHDGRCKQIHRAMATTPKGTIFTASIDQLEFVLFDIHDDDDAWNETKRGEVKWQENETFSKETKRRFLRESSTQNISKKSSGRDLQSSLHLGKSKMQKLLYYVSFVSPLLYRYKLQTTLAGALGWFTSLISMCLWIKIMHNY